MKVNRLFCLLDHQHGMSAHRENLKAQTQMNAVLYHHYDIRHKYECRLVVGVAVFSMSHENAGTPARSRQPEKPLQKLPGQAERSMKMGRLDQLLPPVQAVLNPHIRYVSDVYFVAQIVTSGFDFPCMLKATCQGPDFLL